MNQLYNGCPYPRENKKAAKRWGNICEYVDAEKIAESLFHMDDTSIIDQMVLAAIKSGEWDSEIEDAFVSGKAKCPLCGGNYAVDGDYGPEPCPVCCAE